MSFKRLIYICLVILFALLFIVSCSDDQQGGEKNVHAYTYPEIEDVNEPDVEEDIEEDIEEDTYSIYTDPCVECAWYFCGNLDVVWQKQICINNCNSPPTIVFEGECEAHLECNPSQPVLEANIPCITEVGYPGT